MVARSQPLQDYLRNQLKRLDLEPRARWLCERIILRLDRNGYLSIELDQLIETRLGDDLQLATRALAIIQTLDPPGVGARHLRECLLLQLRPEMLRYDEMRTLISRHLEELEDNRLSDIERRTGYSMTTIRETLDELRKLTPKPGAIVSGLS